MAWDMAKVYLTFFHKVTGSICGIRLLLQKQKWWGVIELGQHWEADRPASAPSWPFVGYMNLGEYPELSEPLFPPSLRRSFIPHWTVVRFKIKHLSRHLEQCLGSGVFRL